MRSLEKSGGQLNPGDLQVFTDRDDIADWARDKAALAVSAGIVRGFAGRFEPQRDATRAEAVVMVKRLLDKTAE